MLQLFDTHQHLVYQDQASYGWTAEIPILAKSDFTIKDYQSLVQDLGVGGCLFMEVGVDDLDYQKEIRFVSTLASNPANNIKGLIASIRPETDAGFDAWLDESNELGAIAYRRVLHVVDDAISTSDTFRRNVRKIGDKGKVFDLVFRADQLAIALEFAKACANTSLVLNHCGAPNIAAREFDSWRAGLTALARVPNVICKLSGLMAYCAPGKSSLEEIKPYVDHVLEAFGPQRMVWGSDWPVVNLGKGLPEWIAVTRTILAELSEDEARQVAFGTAEKVYGVSMF